MLNATKQQEFNIVVITSIDRLSRDYQKAIAIIKELESHHITVESVDGHDLGDVMKLAQAIKKGVTQIEQQQLIKRRQYGIKAKKSQEQ